MFKIVISAVAGLLVILLGVFAVSSFSDWRGDLLEVKDVKR